ncbi:MAG: hypothetical protein AB2794_17465 [Candidatus Thiodiazotropha endolucinida]
MVYTPDKLNFIIGPSETNDDVAIQKVIEHLEWEEGRKATPDEIATITTDVRRMMAAHTDYLVHGDRQPQPDFYAADLLRKFIKK